MKQYLKCIRCGRVYPLHDTRFRCDCGGLLEVRYSHFPGPSIVDTWEKRTGSREPLDQSGVWRYREFLIRSSNPVTYPEGRTNLYKLGVDGFENLYVKHEGENPTGSFKDRGMTVGITHAKDLGMKAVACASTGNTSASMAAYAARAGIKAFVFLPSGRVAAGKLAQAVAYGATIFEVMGDFDDAMNMVVKVSKELGIYLLNSLNPVRLEGQKTIVIDTLHQLDWEIPDWIILPGGNLGNTSAFGKALMELKEAGIITKVPRLATIQALGAAPFFRSFVNGFKTFQPVKAETVATAIRIGNPVNFEKAKAGIQFTKGIVEAVTDREILDAKRILDRSGIGCEPASAASLAGVLKLYKMGVIKGYERIVLILTGNLLKDPEIVPKVHDVRSIRVSSRFEDIRGILKEVIP